MSVGSVGTVGARDRLTDVHLYWNLAPDESPVVEASAVLEVLTLPKVAATYFWALQASFTDSEGTELGAAHLGLQWYPPHPDSRAVNWGGYPPAHADWKRVLKGSRSQLRSTTHDPNTRDYPWMDRRPYELRIGPAPVRRPRPLRPPHPRGWRGTITDLTTGEATVVRDLFAPGDRLHGLVVWTEWFCACTDPMVDVQWSSLRTRTADGRQHIPTSVMVNHPAENCQNVAHEVAATVPELVIRQVMNTERHVAHGTVLPVRPDWGGPGEVL